MATEYILTGRIKVIFDTTTHGDKGFRKREFVVTTDGRYSQDIKLQALKDRCDTLDQFYPGAEVSVKFDVLGNEKDGKYYVSLEAWAIMFVGADGTRREAQPQQQSGVNEEAKAALRAAASKGMNALKDAFMGFTAPLKKELTAFKDSLKAQAEAADARPASPLDDEDEIPF